MRISELIESLKEDLVYLKDEKYQRHSPAYYYEQKYYDDLCCLIDKLDAQDSNILGDKIRQEDKKYAEHNLDYESYLQGLIGYSYMVRKYNLYDILDKVLLPTLEKDQKYLLEMFNKKENK